MNRFSLRGRAVLDGTLVPAAIVVEDHRIASILRDPREADIPDPVYEADIVAPGFIDLQVNGGFEADVGADPEAIRKLSRCLSQTGVTAYLPTAVTSPLEFYPRLFEAFEAARGANGAQPLGLHLEGPFLSRERHGAHRPELMRPPTLDVVQSLLVTGYVKLVTLAPEEPGALPCITLLRDRGVVVSLGHTNASYDEFVRGVDAGARMGTHLYNAMSPFGHRAPNAAGAALVDDRITVGLIPDGIHSHPAALRLALRAKGTARVVLVTDMMAGAGMAPGRYDLGGREVIVDEESARLPDGTLAGSILTLDRAIANIVGWTGLSAAEAIKMATEVPAGLLGLEDKGSIRIGYDADLVLLDRDLQVQATFIRGKSVFTRRGAA